MSANSVTKSVYAQSNSLAQKGGGIADQLREQIQTSNQDNQVVSGDSSVLSGNNLLCQDQDNSQVSDESCDSGFGVSREPSVDFPLVLLLIINTNEQSPHYTITIEQFDRDHKSIDKSHETMDTSLYTDDKDLEDGIDSFDLVIQGLPIDPRVSASVDSFPIEIDCSDPRSGNVICNANNLFSTTERYMFGNITINVPG